jgi:hypothetical protein
MKILSKKEIAGLFNEILEVPETVKDLNSNQIGRVKQYAQNRLREESLFITEMFIHNPDNQNFKNTTVKEWGLKHHSGYQDAFKVLSIIENHLKQKNEPEQQSQKLTGFYTGFNDRQLERLYHYFTKEIFFIHSGTKYEHFKAAFKEDYLPGDYTPIKRTGKFTNVLLAYFIYKYFNQGNEKIWKKTNYLFYNTKITASTRANYSQYNKKEKPKNAILIDNIKKILNL